MKCIAYRSRIRDGLDAKKTLAGIYAVAASENPVRGITGVLIYHDRNVLQVLEGAEKQLDQLMDNIRHDDRHTDFTILCETRINERSLSQWNMEVANLDAFDQFTHAQLQKAVELTEQNMKMNSDTFLFMLNELLREPEFQALLG